MTSDTGSDPRSAALRYWFAELCGRHELGTVSGGIEPVSGDASFRRYFRGRTDRGSWVLVDAPTDKENSEPFLAVQALLARAGVHVPEVIAVEPVQGFLCLEDLGDELLLHRLRRDPDQAAQLYRQAFAELLKIQSCEPAGARLPLFDRTRLGNEMELFRDWLCKGLLKLELSAAEHGMLDAVFALLLDSALAEQQVVVHRDFHSRNLMLSGKGLGVIDFQDAVTGPFSYDLVSLLKDCYIAWPADRVSGWALQYLRLADEAGIVRGLEAERFLRDFTLMGAQRHLKAAGIFCRLWLRDGKPGYLVDIPRTLAYIIDAGFGQAKLREFSAWLERRVMPALTHKLETLHGIAT